MTNQNSEASQMPLWLKCAKLQQQEYYELLPEYTKYEKREYKYLKQNIGFALFGPPSEITGDKDLVDDSAETDDILNKLRYKPMLQTVIDKIFDQVRKNGEGAVEKECIYFGIIFNITFSTKNNSTENISPSAIENEVDDNEKLKIDIQSTPIFKIKRIIVNKDSKTYKNKSCACEEWYIDAWARLYTSWAYYKETNVLHPCTMVIPKDGFYQPDPLCEMTEEYSTVWLEVLESPANSTAATVVNYADKAATVVGAASLALGVAAMFTPAAPLVVGAVVTSTVSGVWSTGRAVQNLADRSKHNQSISITEREALGPWLSIAGGVLGATAARGNMMFVKAIQNGSHINSFMKFAYNTVLVSNLGVNGCGVAYNAYCMYEKYQQGDEITMYDLLSFGTHVLFFSSAVMKFQFAGDLIESTQGKILDEYRASLRSKRLRTAFNRAKRNAAANTSDVTAQNAEVIRYINKKAELQLQNNSQNNSNNSSKNKSQSTPKNNSQSSSESNLKNTSKNNSENTSQSTSKNNSQSDSQNNSQNNSNNSSKNNSQNTSKNNSQSSSESNLKNTSKNNSENTSQSTSKNNSQSNSQNNSQNNSNNSSKNNSQNTSKNNSHSSSESNLKNTSKNNSENTSQSTSKNNSQSNSQNNSQNNSNNSSKNNSQNTPKNNSQSSSESNLKNTSKNNSENTSQSTPKNNSQTKSENNSQNNSNNSSKNNSQSNSESNLKNTSKNNSENTSQSTPKNNSQSKSENNSQNNSNNSSKNNSENNSQNTSKSNSQSSSTNNSKDNSQSTSKNNSVSISENNLQTSSFGNSFTWSFKNGKIEINDIVMLDPFKLVTILLAARRQFAQNQTQSNKKNGNMIQYDLIQRTVKNSLVCIQIKMASKHGKKYVSVPDIFKFDKICGDMMYMKDASIILPQVFEIAYSLVEYVGGVEVIHEAVYFVWYYVKESLKQKYYIVSSFMSNPKIQANISSIITALCENMSCTVQQLLPAFKMYSNAIN
ncbi:uncharacterized protein LOC100877667 [Megachile rotundata]|uniref:uncharacterized protein LOC100877667 n=1 Tax=Megachile rotundata TaxID=143995 RepID=UPI003FD31993